MEITWPVCAICGLVKLADKTLAVGNDNKIIISPLHMLAQSVYVSGDNARIRIQIPRV